ncbi:(R)-2-hydroxyglutaryl-CoA dehydratase subunit beta [Thermosulfidibacter takaii ABI70S6]|uniref:(R)-2-hydroxyglutaryl-CoA dehydratase subunit beta n=1 Tax=Thermosulfidibacter takaii (strain DSM 17441 / JCM 13301 / NBRC 103674 / ABI70S6) TaxID=1298851 RepID=A0A0S3QRU4_THET7|nr:2-hydroxyacyl-CoA dehydratase family protein [Thermosulfidibacter takaii]BAT70993.1 (R)-2-hydroxyglutaryl-CoA dehydratase subunit beta [Thermosulfidibacter takaii ABI70S6]
MEKLPSRKEVIEKAKKDGYLIAAIYPIYYPRELFRAFGILPVEVWGPPKVDTKKGTAHLQPYICSVVKCGLSFLLSDGLEVADLLLVPHCCDSLQGLGTILLDFIKPKQRVVTFYLPRSRRGVDEEFLINELKRIFDQLCVITGKKPTEDDLMREILLEEEADKLALEMYERRKKLDISDINFYRVMRLREYLPSSEWIPLAKEILSRKSEGDSNGKVPLFFSGVLLEPLELLFAIEEMGAFVAGDDLACLRRRVFEAGESSDPFVRMAERILSGPPCPMRGDSFEERKKFLDSILKQTNAKAVVFYNVKFCEPEHFYYPELRKWLKEKGVQTTLVEIDISEPLPQQVVNRIRALVESAVTV